MRVASWHDTSHAAIAAASSIFGDDYVGQVGGTTADIQPTAEAMCARRTIRGTATGKTEATWGATAAPRLVVLKNTVLHQQRAAGENSCAYSNTV